MNYRKLILIIIGIFLIPLSAMAAAETMDINDDFGIPDPHYIFGLICLLYWILVLPNIVIESYVFRLYLPEMKFSKTLLSTFSVNIIIALIGLPTIWFLLWLVMYNIPGSQEGFPNLSETWKIILGITVGAPFFHIKNIEMEKIIWLIPATAIFFLMPVYLISAWLKNIFLLKIIEVPFNGSLVKKACWKANLASYGFCFLVCVGLIIWSYLWESGIHS